LQNINQDRGAHADFQFTSPLTLSMYSIVVDPSLNLPQHFSRSALTWSLIRLNWILFYITGPPILLIWIV